MHIILQTPRLMFRRFTDSDADAAFILELNSNIEVLKYLHEPILQDAAHAREILQTIILPQYEENLGRWAVHLNENNQLIGWCGLKYRPELDETDLGYRFIKSAWSQGYATEAAAATLQYGFKILQLKTITGRAHINNIASLAFLKKIGMQFIREENIDHCPVKIFVAENSRNKSQ